MRVRIAFRAQGVGCMFRLYYVASCLLYSWSLVYPFDVWRGMQENAGRCVIVCQGGMFTLGDWDGTAVRDDTDTGSCVDWDLFNCVFDYLYLSFWQRCAIPSYRHVRMRGAVPQHELTRPRPRHGS